MDIYSKKDLSGKDGFFMTIIGAWISIRTDLWLHPKSLILLITSLFCFSEIISYIHYFFCPNKKEPSTKKINTIIAFGETIYIVVVVCYFTWGNTIIQYKSFNKELINVYDGVIIGILLILWLVDAGSEVLSSKKNI